MDSLISLVHKYQVTSLFLFAFFGLSIASAIDANKNLLANSFPPEFTIYDIFHPLLGVFYAGVKIPKDCGSGSPWLIVHLVFAYIHLGKSLARLDASVDVNTYPAISAFFFPITDFIDEHVSLVYWILFASTIYFIRAILSPIDQKSLNYQEAINELTQQLAEEKSRSATTSNDQDDWKSMFHVEQAISNATSTALEEEKTRSSKLTEQANLDKAEISKLRQLLSNSESSLTKERAYINKANRRIGSMIKFADEKDRRHVSALAQNRVDIHQEYRNELKRRDTLRVVIKLKEVEGALVEAEERIKGLEKDAVEKAVDSKKEIAKVKAELWRKESKLAVLKEVNAFLAEFAKEVGALVQWSNFKDFMESRRKYWDEEWDVYWNCTTDDDEEDGDDDADADTDAEDESDEEE